MEIGKLAIVVATHKECALTIYNGIATISVGAGIERRSYSCSITDEALISEFIAHINFGNTITSAHPNTRSTPLANNWKEKSQ